MTDLRKNKTITLIVLGAFVLGVLLAGTACYLAPIQPSQAVDGETVSVGQNPVGTNLIADIVEKTSPAVVLIETTAQTKRNYDPFFNDPFFRDFFGNRAPYEGGTEITQGMGSGFLISKDGYILTNQHVVAGANKIEVVLEKGNKRVMAKVMGSDAELDLAVLKIDAGNNLPYLEIGDSNQVRVGDWSIAIGNPHGLDHTVTVGVISAKGRPITIQNRDYKNLLQTDASINPGNSGGPLLNMKGQVIGINTAVNASAQGIGFAIPTSTVSPVLNTLKNKGSISHPWIGVYIQPVTDDIAKYLGMDKPEGILISDVVDGGPAGSAGLAQGDVLLEADRQKINTTRDLTTKIENSKVGQKITLLVFRNKQIVNVPVVIGDKGNAQ
ncbi:MAG: peptidase S1 [Peptococcaceae bacterium BRH_c4b]|nr:MAG: peptidase S1 [Peptococcaceae bacterium BRH_c4b]